MKDLDIQVGDRVTYKSGKDQRQVIMTNEEQIENYESNVLIIKIERIGINGWYTVYEKKPEILDEKEKEYLTSVIKPFKSKIECIKKTRKLYSNFEYVCIVLKENNIGALPDFKQGTMYKNMTAEKRYTLKELGLE